MSDLSEGLGAGAGLHTCAPAARAGLDASATVMHAAISAGGFDACRRALRLHTAWPTSALLPERATLQEAVNDLFDLDLQLLSPRPDLDVSRLLGSEATLELQLADGRLRPVHGVVMEAGALGSDGGFARYRLRLQPWLALLGHRRDSFLFQNVTALEAVESVLRDYPQANWRVMVTEPLRRREICTQFDETDLNFVLRLLAEEGLSFHFEHERGADGAGAHGGEPRSRHILVITDRAANRPHLGSLRFHRLDATETTDGLTHWQAGLRLTSSATALGAWDPQQLTGIAAQDASARALGARPLLERYDGAGEGRYADAAHAQRAALLALQAEELTAHTAHGAGSSRVLTAGARFTLAQHHHDDGDYTVLAVQHEAANNLGAEMARLLDAPDLEGGAYRNRFTAVPADVAIVPPHAGRPWRPTAHAHWPAIVVGVQGEVLTTDRDHRIKVQFPWQRGQRPVTGGLAHDVMGTGDEGRARQHASSADKTRAALGESSGERGNAPFNESSEDHGNAPLNASSGTWLRVAVPQAGPDWGAVLPPRIGSEVLVGFIEGDIDRPIVLQALHNELDAPPFPAGVDGAANHPGVIGGWHTAWLDGAGCNQWLLDDATGQLRMRLHCSHALSELAVGHLIQQPAQAVNTSAWRGAWRGAGFELITQGWATLRAAGGMLVSSCERPGRSSHGSAESTQMDAAQAVSQLHGAQQLAQALSEAAQAQGAQPLAAHAQSIPELIRGVDPQQDGRLDAPLNGQDAHKGVRPGVGGVAGADGGVEASVSSDGSPAAPGPSHPSDTPAAGPVERPAAPTLMLEAAHSSLLATEATLASFTGGDFALVSQGDAHAAAAHTASTVVGGTASHYTHAGGMKLIAAAGPVSLRAHTGELDVQAEQALTLTSVHDEIHASAQGRIVLTAGSSRIVLDGANITFTCPGTFTVKAAAHAFEGGGGGPAMLPVLPDTRAKLYHERVRAIDPATGEAIAGMPYRVELADGTVLKGITDANGLTEQILTADPQGIRLYWEPLLGGRTSVEPNPVEGC
ncbi:MAG: type VI secretion system Vgr family protein [Pseudomonadota bacterium]